MLLFVSKTSTIYLNLREESQAKMKISKLIEQHFSVSDSIGPLSQLATIIINKENPPGW